MPGYEMPKPNIVKRPVGFVLICILIGIILGAGVIFGSAMIWPDRVAPATVAVEAVTQPCINEGTIVVVEAVTSSKVDEEIKEEPDAFSMQSLVSYRKEDGTSVVCRHTYTDLVGALKPGQKIKFGKTDRTVTRVL